MNTKVAKDAIKVFRKEQKRRLASLPDDPSIADHLWQAVDEPFVNDLCLMLLVAVRHQVERELLNLVARVTDDGPTTLTYRQYQERLNDERTSLKNKNGWRKLAVRLELNSLPEWDSSMDVLRLLANGQVPIFL